MKADKARITATAVTAGKAVTTVLEISCVPFRFCGQVLFICGVSFAHHENASQRHTADNRQRNPPYREFCCGGSWRGGRAAVRFCGSSGRESWAALRLFGSSRRRVGLLFGFAAAAGAEVGLLFGFAVAVGAGVGLLSPVLRGQQARASGRRSVLRWQQAQGRAALRFWGSRGRGVAGAASFSKLP